MVDMKGMKGGRKKGIRAVSAFFIEPDFSIYWLLIIYSQLNQCNYPKSNRFDSRSCQIEMLSKLGRAFVLLESIKGELLHPHSVNDYYLSW